LAFALPLMAQRSAPATGKAVDPLAKGEIFNIVDWDGGQLPQRYERSDQLPMSLEDVGKLSASKFSSGAITKMLEERRCACDASVDALVALKEAGVAEEVIQAVSLHSLPPNRSFGLMISLDFEGLGGAAAVSNEARKGYLYLIVPDGDKERVFIGNLQAILAGRWQRDALVDQTDLLLPKKVRRVTFAAEVPLKTYGPKKVLVFTSTKPDIYTSADIPEKDRPGVQEFDFDYPSSSLERICNLQVLYRQDAMLANRWHLERTHFQCEWD
jgi:hypothetical protein|tara:strand:+ start:654 stop:1463 length:810 start_codon:yes stop_codon:yes gene_type:complete